MPTLAVEFLRLPAQAGEARNFTLSYLNSQGNPQTTQARLAGNGLTFTWNDGLARAVPDPGKDGRAMRITAGTGQNVSFDLNFDLPNQAYAALADSPCRATVRVVPCYDARLVRNPVRQQLAGSADGARSAKQAIFLPVFVGSAGCKPRIRHAIPVRTSGEARDSTGTVRFLEIDEKMLQFQDGMWGLVLRPDGIPALRGGVKDEGWLQLVPADTDPTENFRVVGPQFAGELPLDSLPDACPSALKICLGDREDWFWPDADLTIHLPHQGGVALRPSDLSVELAGLKGPPRPCTQTIGADGKVSMTFDDLTVQAVVDTTHPLYLVLDLGASTHLCGLHRPGGGTTMLRCGPGGISSGHDDKETPGTIYSLTPLTATAAAVADPLWQWRGLDIPPPSHDRPLRPATGRCTAQQARNALSRHRVLTDLKWLLHLAPDGSDRIGIPGRDRLAAEFAHVVGLRCKEALQELLASPPFPQTPGEGTAPLLALVVALPGYLRADVHRSLLDHLADLSSCLHSQIPGLTQTPADHFGRVYLVPEPFALLAGHLAQDAQGAAAVIAIDAGMRTFDAARVDISADGSGRQPRRCLSANLGGRALDYAILAALRHLARPSTGAEGRIGDLLGIDDTEMLRRFALAQPDALVRGEAMLEIVEAAKCTMNDRGLMTFDLSGQAAVLGEAAIGDLFQSLQNVVSPGGTARCWQIAWDRLVGQPPLAAFFKAVGAVVADCLSGLPETGSCTLRIGGRASLFPPMVAAIEKVAGAQPGIRILKLDSPAMAKADVVRGAALLAADRQMLIGRVDMKFFLVQLQSTSEKASKVDEIGSDTVISVPVAGRVLVVAIGREMARALRETHDPEALCRTFFQGECLEKALSVSADARVHVSFVSGAGDGTQVVRLSEGERAQDFVFLRPGGLFA